MNNIFNLVCVFMIVFGILGLAYYWRYYKHFVWKTSYSALLPLPILFLLSTNSIFYGTVQPLTSNRGIKLEGDRPSLWNGNIYEFQYNGTEKLFQTNIKDLLNPVQKPILSLPGHTSQYGIHKNLLYAYEKINNQSQLIIYDLNSTDTPQELHRLTFSGDTMFNGYIRPMGDDIGLMYSIPTGSQYVYLDKNNQPTTKDKSTLSYTQFLFKRYFVRINLASGNIIGQYDMETSQSYRYYLFDPIYGDYGYHVTTTGIWSYPVSDWKSPNPTQILSTPDNNFIFAIEKNYLFKTSNEHALEIYDISNIQKPSLVGALNWDYLESLDLPKKFSDFANWNYYYPTGKILISGQRAIVIYNRGFMVIDISNPASPRLISKMNSDKVDNAIADNGYLFANGILKGFSVYKLP